MPKKPGGAQRNIEAGEQDSGHVLVEHGFRPIRLVQHDARRISFELGGAHAIVIVALDKRIDKVV